jgi:site-specific DNA recombinase
LLATLKKHKNYADLLLFTKWDRFSRNAGDAYSMISQLNRLGVEPQAMEQPLDLAIPENKIMLAFYLAAPEVENDRRALNVLVGMRRARKEGRLMATAPKGYKNTRDELNNKIISPSDDAIYIKFIFEELANGIYNIEQVRKMAVHKGFDCSKNNMWILVRNPVYCGKIQVPAYKDEPADIVNGSHPSIVSEELFYKVQDILDGRKRNVPMKNTAKDELPLRGFLVCKRCGQKLTGSASKGRAGDRYFYYHCKKGCGERFKAPEANRLFLSELLKFEIKPQVIDAYHKVMQEMFKNNEENKSQAIKSINSEINLNKERITKAQQMMLDGDISASEFKEIKAKFQPEIDRLSRKVIEV